jgi:hypothetical protein
MSNTNVTFVDYVTPVTAAWLNNVNAVVNSSAAVPSIAQLRLTSSTNATFAIVNGYTTVGDGGGGVYAFNAADVTSADNGGTIIVGNDGGRWYLQHNNAVSVKQFGATGNGSTDDTSTIQNAINVAQLTGAELYFPPGTYQYTTLSITGSIKISGAGRNATFFHQNSTTNVGIVVNTPSPVIFEGIFFYPIGTPTAGAAISLTASTSNTESVFRDCSFAGNYIGIETIAAAQWVVDSCYFSQYIATGILVQNTTTADSGDSDVVDCLFSSSGNSAQGILQYSSGGLKISNTKFIGGGYGYLLQLAVGAATSDLLFSNCSLENHTVAAIDISRQGSSGTFANIVVNGCQFAPASGGIPMSFGDFTAGWLSGVVVNGCNITITNATAIFINDVAVFNVTGNNFLGVGASQNGITIAAGASNGTIGPNTYNNLGNPINNSSVSTAIVPRTVTGTVNISCTTGEGSIFVGTQVVTLPGGVFQSAPVATGSITAGNGISVGYSTSSPSAVTLFATAAVSGTVTVSYVISAPY